MSFQKCPVCNGHGKTTADLSTVPYSQCKTCEGYGIINTFTGKPPKDNTEKVNLEVNPFGQRIETQQEYFGK